MYFQGRNRDRGVEKRLVDPGWKERVDQLERVVLKHAYYHIQNR